MKGTVPEGDSFSGTDSSGKDDTPRVTTELKTPKKKNSLVDQASVQFLSDQLQQVCMDMDVKEQDSINTIQ